MATPDAIHPLCDCLGRQSLPNRTLRAKRASRRASPAAQALRSDVLRRAASPGGTLRCAEARRVACRNVDKSYASNRRPQHGAVARRLQDSAAAIKRGPSVCDAIIDTRVVFDCEPASSEPVILISADLFEERRDFAAIEYATILERRRTTRLSQSPNRQQKNRNLQSLGIVRGICL